MKTFNYTIKELFNKGLRPLEESPRNGSFLTAASNCRMTEGGLVGADKYTRKFNLNETAQVFHAFKGTFILTADSIYSYDYYSDTYSLVVGSIPPGLMWSMADFGEYLLFTNGNINLIRDPTTGDFNVDIGIVFPVARSICAHRGRLILGGPKRYPTADGYHRNWVAWSDVNSIDFISATNLTQTRQNLSGYMPMPWEGDVLRVIPMNDKVVVYGDNGITAIVLASASGISSTYGQAPIRETGLLSDRAATTNGEQDEGTLHYFLDNTGWLCEMNNDLQVKRLGYKEFLN